MTQWPSGNPQPSETINNPPRSALGEFALLAAGVALAAAVLAGLLALTAGWLAPYIPFSWEERATAAFADDHTAETDAEEAVQRLGQALARATDLPDGIRVRFHLLDSATPNAFATLGGHIMVTTGLVREVSSENALAMVLAHEIAHIAERHPIATLTRTAIFQLVWAAVVGGDTSMGGLTARAGQLTGLSFNRDMERTADRAALTTLERHYGHVRGAGEFFERMLDRRDEAAWQAFFRSHPATRERLDTIAEAAEPGKDASLTPLPTALRDP